MNDVREREGVCGGSGIEFDFELFVLEEEMRKTLGHIKLLRKLTYLERNLL